MSAVCTAGAGVQVLQPLSLLVLVPVMVSVMVSLLAPVLMPVVLVLVLVLVAAGTAGAPGAAAGCLTAAIQPRHPHSSLQQPASPAAAA